MADVRMPKLSDTMEEGTVLAWKVPSGEAVLEGQAIAEIESDKASFEIEAEASGPLAIVVEAGRPVPVGEVIARIGAAGAAPTRAAAPPAPAPKAAAEPPLAAVAPPTVPETVAAPIQGAPFREGGPKASPLARRLASERGVDLASLKGTGPEGRIVREDVLAATPPAAAAQAPAPAIGAIPPGASVETLSRMQATIARRMAVSKSSVPHFYVTVQARVDDAISLRRQLVEILPEAARLTITDLVTRACAMALVKFPEVNTSFVDGNLVHLGEVNIGLAVPPAEGLGLLVPVLHNVDRKDLVTISIESRQMIERARAGRPTSADLTGGGFSISNLGMYGVEDFQAIINPPESAILAVGAMTRVPVLEDDKVVAATVMRMTLSADHRVFYGVTAAQFMAEVKRLLENPVALMLPPAA